MENEGPKCKGVKNVRLEKAGPESTRMKNEGLSNCSSVRENVAFV